MDRARTELILVDEDPPARRRRRPRAHLGPPQDPQRTTVRHDRVRRHRRLEHHDLGQRAASRSPAATSAFRSARFNYTTTEERALWHSAVASYDDALCLFDHTPGELTALADYLYGPHPGLHRALSYLVCIAAQEAISDGTRTHHS